MTLQRAAAIAGLTAAAAILVWVVFVGLPRWYGRPPDGAPQPADAAAATGRTINVRLFYVAEDGTSLTSVVREVPFFDNVVDQARAIITAQVAPATEPLLSAVPAGTQLRALFVTEGGEAYVDFSPELVSGHSGGSMNEMLTIYTMVDALTVNLPAITAVQILVNGRELDTLAGHVDLRRPLLKKVQ